ERLEGMLRGDQGGVREVPHGSVAADVPDETADRDRGEPAFEGSAAGGAARRSAVFAVLRLSSRRGPPPGSPDDLPGPRGRGGGIQPLEPSFPWSGEFLQMRARAYEETNDPRAALARREAEEFRSHEAVPFNTGLSVPTK